MACLLRGHRSQWRCRLALGKGPPRVIDLCCHGGGAGKDLWGSSSRKQFDPWCLDQRGPVVGLGRRETVLVKIQSLTARAVAFW